MPGKQLLDPVSGDEVPKVDNAIAIGEDLAFQERWWTFERIIWSFFVLVLIADLLGAFGQGWLAKAKTSDSAGAITVDYERIERAMTPSILKIAFNTESDPSIAAGGKLHLFVSDSVVKDLGAQRIIPQPESSVLDRGGVQYTFPYQEGKAEIQFALEPSLPGIYSFTVQVPGRSPVTERVVVMP